MSVDSGRRHTVKRPKPRQLDGTASEWRYRGRSDSEQAERQPIPAPSTLATQRDEGFQRFYKAVISPTHVRVTAGGRIVPNPKGSSPTGKWQRDAVTGDTTSSALPKSCAHPDHQGFPFPHPGYSQFPPMFPAFAPGLPQGSPPFPLIPWHIGLGMGGGYGIVSPHLMGNTQSSSNTAKRDGSSKSDRHKEIGVGVSSASPRTCLPTHMDQQHPFPFGGQWMWPPSGSFYAYGVPPMPTYPHSQMPGIAMHAVAGSTTSSNHGHDQTTSQPRHPSMPVATSSSINPPPAFVPSSSNPPISSIRPSDITKKQIDVLRGSLRYLEDQLQYNRHQIDEKGMENQAQLVRQQIAQFQKNFDEQLAYEECHYPNGGKRDDFGSSASSYGALRSKSSTSSMNAKADPKHGVGLSREGDSSRVKAAKCRPNKDRSSHRSGSGINSTRSTSAFASKKSTLERTDYGEEALTKLSSLPIRAALAPPFQPRHQYANRSGAATEDEVKSLDISEPKRPAAMVRDRVRHESHHLSPVRSSQTESLHSGPYLVGRITRGLHPNLAQRVDYTYSRDLTEDELRARHMYWGKAPHHLQKGLPKFDGKDFYPPSPVKESSESTLSRSYVSDVMTVGSASADQSSTVPKTDPGSPHPISRSSERSRLSGARGSTQSETLPREQSKTTKHQRPGAHAMRGCPSFEDLRDTLLDTARPSSNSSKGKSSSDDGEDDKALLFKGRRSMARSG